MQNYNEEIRLATMAELEEMADLTTWEQETYGEYQEIYCTEYQAKY